MKMKARGTRSITAWLLSAVALAAGSSACTETKQLGGLMLAITTDMAAPKDVDMIGLSIVGNGKTVYSAFAEVTPTGEVRFPSTITIQEPKDPNTIFKIRVVAYAKNQARVLRNVTAKVPQGQFRQLRVPLSFLSYGSASGQNSPTESGPTFPDLAPQLLDARCSLEQNQTDVAGECVTLEFFDADKMEKFDESTVFGGGSAPAIDGAGNFTRPSTGTCFDVRTCFAKGTATLLVPDANCTVRNIGARMSIALSTESIGVTTEAYRDLVVMDMDAIPAFGEAGPVLSADAKTFKLPDVVCKRLTAQGPERIVEIFGSTACDPKSRNVPLCGEASATQAALPAGTVTIGEDGGVVVTQQDGSTPAPEPPPIERMASNLKTARALTSFEDHVYVGDDSSIKDVSTQPPTTAVTQVVMQRTAPIYGITVGRRGGNRVLTAMDYGPWTPVGAGTRTSSFYRTTSLDVPVASQDRLFDVDGTDLEPSAIGMLDEFVLLAGGVYLNGYFGTDGGNGIYDTPPFLTSLLGLRVTALTTYGADVLLGHGQGETQRYNGSIRRCAGRVCDTGAMSVIVTPRAPNGSITSMVTLGARMFYTWAPDNGGSTGALSVWSGSSPTDLVTDLTLPKVGSIATDGKNVYYASNDVIYAVSITGGAPVRIAPRSGSYAEHVGRIAVTQRHVYWVTAPETTTGTVYRRLLE